LRERIHVNAEGAWMWRRRAESRIGDSRR
jgi:hypothetical protein